jgi:hypothetical protein
MKKDYTFMRSVAFFKAVEKYLETHEDKQLKNMFMLRESFGNDVDIMADYPTANALGLDLIMFKE